MTLAMGWKQYLCIESSMAHSVRQTLILVLEMLNICGYNLHLP